MLWEILDYDILRQQTPVMIYKRLTVPFGDTTFEYMPTIDEGYSFLLREIRWKSNMQDVSDGVANYDVRLEFIRSLRGRELQNVPLPPGLFSTPGKQYGLFAAAPAPVDMDIGGQVADAVPVVKNNLFLNYLYQHRETIKIRLSNPAAGADGKLDLVLIGYQIPDTTLDLWR